MSVLATVRIHEFALLLVCTSAPLTTALLLHRASLRAPASLAAPPARPFCQPHPTRQTSLLIPNSMAVFT
jgi:hypothetical protein